MQDWLQVFAWTESEKALLTEERCKILAQLAPGLDEEPMFCFETALKLFYWSCLCYEYEEVMNTTKKLHLIV